MRRPREQKIDKLKAELVQAKEKANEWQTRVRDIERQITEQENLEIIQAVRGIAAAPEELRAVLDMIRAANAKEPPESNITSQEEA